MARIQTTVSGAARESVLAVNKVLRNTYLLLSATLLFSGATAYYSMISGVQLSIVVLLVGMFGLYFLTMSLRNSAWGLVAIFAYTGFMGYTLGPILNMYIHQFSNGPQLIMTSLGTTGLIFFSLSAYTLVSRKDFSYMGGFLAVAILSAFILGLFGMFFHWPLLQLVISGAFAVISSAYILFTTSAIINGGERNYISATISLYIAIFNLFLSLLRILSAFTGGSRN